MRALLFMLIVMICPAVQAQSSIFVREECGFSFAPCGEIGGGVYLTEDGPSFNYYQSASGPTFSLAYADDSFIMTAFVPNTIGTSGSLPFGLDIYPGTGPFLPPISGCTECEVTSLAFRPWFNFPTDPASPLVVALPPQVTTPVPEPSTLVLMVAMGLMLLAATRWRSRASGLA